MATKQYRTKESGINYSNTKTYGGNKGGKANRGLPVESDKCRICIQARKQ